MNPRREPAASATRVKPMTVNELIKILEAVPNKSLPVYIQINDDVCEVKRAGKEWTQETMWPFGRNQRDLEAALVLA